MDAFGKTLAIENMRVSTDKWTYYLITNERDAQLKPSDSSVQFNYGEATFFLYDHLGNTRVSYSKLDSGLMVHSLTDYFPYGKILREYVSTRPRYLTTQHERDTETDLDYRGARYYDSEYGRFLSIDPLANKFAEWSPYSINFNNPLRFVDSDGKQPTPAEAARMAAHVYGDKKDNILIGGWHVSKRNFGIKLEDNETGLKSQVYERTVNGKTEYTYATAGTEANWKDVGADVKQPLGLSDQYEKAVDNAKQISKSLGSTELTYVGHSLGGGEAALNALVTNRKAITFNAAGVGSITKYVEGGWSTLMKNESKIKAYIMLTDPLNLLQNNSSIMPDVNGKRHYLKPSDSSSVFNGHSMDNMLKNFGIKYIKRYNL